MAFERITQKDWYKILGAKPSDSLAELKRKYQKLALLHSIQLLCLLAVIHRTLSAEMDVLCVLLLAHTIRCLSMYHPDKQKADVPAGEVEERVQRFIEIDQAWKILGNEETKKEYDLQQRACY
ncbi:dnaJ homolog subfamily C member 24 isoform 3-T3 [Theristicus caerulescens]